MFLSFLCVQFVGTFVCRILGSERLHHNWLAIGGEKMLIDDRPVNGAVNVGFLLKMRKMIVMATRPGNGVCLRLTRNRTCVSPARRKSLASSTVSAILLSFRCP